MTEEQLATVPTADAGLTTPNGTGDLDVVRIYHPELDAYGEAPRAGVPQMPGWEVVEPTPAEAAARVDYDPGAHSVAEVVAQLEQSTDAEREAIVALERDGKARKTVLEWAPADTGDAPS